MYELSRIAEDPSFATRVFPVVMPDAGIFDPLELVRHVKHWETRQKELDEAMRTVGQENLQGIREDLDLYETIRNTIAGILNVLREMNTLTVAAHQADGFERLYRSLEKALDLGRSPTADH
ncbi:hypothetical protein MVA48_05510 [Blastococcus sp. PRF04-17]|nr:hypothetical protein [Blastococcus sp. PRF04-17]UOY02817.1 hypothetical protein MVA48_05510 [Blastococcus sp. PRF04-17]